MLITDIIINTCKRYLCHRDVFICDNWHESVSSNLQILAIQIDSVVHNNDFDLRFQWQCAYMFSQSCCRYDQCRSPSPSRTWLQNALSPELSQASVRYHAGVLEEGGDGETHFWDLAVETGGVLHHRGLRLQGSGQCQIKSHYSRTGIYCCLTLFCAHCWRWLEGLSRRTLTEPRIHRVHDQVEHIAVLSAH